MGPKTGSSRSRAQSRAATCRLKQATTRNDLVETHGRDMEEIVAEVARLPLESHQLDTAGEGALASAVAGTGVEAGDFLSTTKPSFSSRCSMALKSSFISRSKSPSRSCTSETCSPAAIA